MASHHESKIQHCISIPGGKQNYTTLLCDTSDPQDDLFHVCKILYIQDGKAAPLNYTTFQRNIITTSRKVNRKVYHAKVVSEPREQEVIERVAIEDVEDYIDDYNVRMTKITKERKQRKKYNLNGELRLH